VPLVDDDMEIRDRLVESLAHEGYEVSTACDGQALGDMLSHRPDVIVIASSSTGRKSSCSIW
jgi:DNA-binding response OmpR family regulator